MEVRDLNPYYVSGFADGEGCFCVSFNKRDALRLGVEVRPSFSLSQGQTSKDLMTSLSYFFKTPNKKIRPDRKTLKYEVRELEHLISEVVPHFEKYPLQSNKQNDFLKFKEVLLLMKDEKHLTPQGLTKILDIAYTMNLDNNSVTRRDKSKEYYLQILADKLK